MHRRLRRAIGFVAILALVATLAVGVTPVASGDDVASPSQPSAIERLVRQEDARRAELAGYDEIVRQNELSAMLDVREQAMGARASAATTAASVVRPASAGGEEFAWGAAALGVGAGVAAACVLLGCVTLARGRGRLRSV